MAVLNLRKIPEELRREYRALCIREGTNMTADVARYMQARVEAAEILAERKREAVAPKRRRR